MKNDIQTNSTRFDDVFPTPDSYLLLLNINKKRKKNSETHARKGIHKKIINYKFTLVLKPLSLLIDLGENLVVPGTFSPRRDKFVNNMQLWKFSSA